MPPGVRVVPWADWYAWAELHDTLLPKSKALLPSAPNTRNADPTWLLALYRLRRAAGLPFAMEATASLVSLLTAPPADPHAHRLALGMALVRLVNAATDRIQPRGDGDRARSVHSLARALRLPPALVEVRHQATHNALPRIEALAEAAEEAIVWLDMVYWTPQAEAAANALGYAIQSRKLVPVPLVLKNVSDASANPDYKVGANSDDKVDANPDDKVDANEADPAPQQSPQPTRTRKRWRRSGTPEDWRGVPIGVMPGSTCTYRFIGIDVGHLVGCDWQPGAGGVLSTTVNDVVEAPPDTESSLWVDGDSSDAEGDVDGEGECARGATTDDFVLKPPAKTKRVLTEAQKFAVERMMHSLIARTESKPTSAREGRDCKATLAIV
jgi:hypothetical protein